MNDNNHSSSRINSDKNLILENCIGSTYSCAIIYHEKGLYEVFWKVQLYDLKIMNHGYFLTTEKTLIYYYNKLIGGG